MPARGVVEVGVAMQTRAEVPRRSRWRWLGYALHFVAAVAVVALIAFLGQRQAAEKIDTIMPIQFIGHSDEAAYALMGKSLSEGRGIYVNYVSMFFNKYPPTITRREDHWPPFMGAAIAVFFHFMGVHAWVARLPGIFFASIGLPLTTALLAYALCRRWYAGLVAGLVIMANADIYTQSLRTLSDGAAAMLVAGFCACIVLAGRRPWFHILAGAFAAAAYYAKGSEMILFALYPLLGALACGIRVFARWRFYAGLAAAFLLVAPFWYANYRGYGNPLHSTQNYVSGFYGFEDWESAAYFPYWGKNVPKTSDRWEKHPTEYWPMSRDQVARASAIILTGAMQTRADVWSDFGSYGTRARDLITGRKRSFAQMLFQGPHVDRPVRPIASWQSPAWELAGVFAVGLLVAALLAVPACLFLWIWKAARRFRRRGDLAPAPARVPPPRQNFIGPTLAVWLVLIAQILFLSYFWEVSNTRFLFPMLPLALALGCAGAAKLIEWPIAFVLLFAGWITQWIRRRKPVPRWAAGTGAVLGYWPAVATLMIAGVVWIYREPVYAAQTDQLEKANVRAQYPWPQDNRFVTTGKWIGSNLPHAVIMCRNPWELCFYMSDTNKAICLPNPTDPDPQAAEEIFAIARYYHVTHILADDLRPCLVPYILHHRPGLDLVKPAPDQLFKIDWRLIPMKTVEQALAPPGKARALTPDHAVPSSARAVTPPR